MELLDDFLAQKQKRKNEKRTFPIAYVNNSDLISFIPFLEKKGIDFRIEKVITHTHATAILPLPSTQLDKLDNLIYVAKEEFSLASKLVKTYIAPAKDLDHKEEGEIPFEASTNWGLLIPTLILVIIFLVQPYSGIFPPFGEELFNSFRSLEPRGLCTLIGSIH